MKVCLLLLVMGVAQCSGANILVMLPLPLYSHMNGYRPLFEELARRGHNVTVASPFPRKEPLANYHDVFINNSLKEMDKRPRVGSQPNPLDSSFWNNVKGTGPFCEVLQDVFLTNTELLKFIKDDRSHFEVIITESWACQEALTVLSHKYSAHLIGISPLLLGSVESYYTGNTIPYSYVPHLKVRATDHMSFMERVKSSILYAADVLLHLYIYLPRKESFMKENIKYPGSENLPPLVDILKNHSLVLVDWQLSLTFPRPYLQNVVEFGGLSVKKASTLPKDLEEYMSDAKDGVIFFSWGSFYNVTNMKPEILTKFLSVFSKLKQRVLMKWENPELPGKPDNVMIAQWLPQASILGHPNLVAFISHCGIHGLAEATYNGVPILATPLFQDQYQNAKVAENSGYAIVLDIETFPEELLLQSLHKLINDPSYKRAAEKKSAIMKDSPIPPLDNAIYWIEYVIRHNGARHLRPASLDIPWFQYFLLDILGLVLLVALCLSVILTSFCKLLCCRSTRHKANMKKSKND